MKLFSYKYHPDHITLFFMGSFVGNFDNWAEVREAENELIND